MPKIKNRFGKIAVVSEERAAEMIAKDGATLIEEVVEVQPEQAVEAPAEKPAENPAEEEASEESAEEKEPTKEELQAALDEKGVKYDKRWGLDRLQELIEINS